MQFKIQIFDRLFIFESYTYHTFLKIFNSLCSSMFVYWCSVTSVIVKPIVNGIS